MAEDAAKGEGVKKAKPGKFRKVKKGKSARQAHPEVEQAHELARLRNNFYRDSYRRLITLLIIVIAMLVILTYYVFYLYKTRPAPKYFATNLNGQIIPLQGLDKPVLSQQQVLDWTRRAVTAAFTHNYVQYKEQIEEAKDTYFTAQGGNAYLKALSDSGDLETMKTLKYIITAQVTEAPQIIEEGKLTGGLYAQRYGWHIQVPAMLVSQNESAYRQTYLNIDLLVVRNSVMVDTTSQIDAIQGIGIGQFGAQVSRPAIGGSI